MMVKESLNDFLETNKKLPNNSYAYPQLHEINNPHTHLFQFAEDLAIVSTNSNKTAAVQNLQDKIAELHNLNLKFNLEKTKFMYMSANNRQQFNISINSTNLKQVQCFKWLGRTISANSTVKVHISNIKKAVTPAFVRSKAEYASTSYANAPKGYNKQLQTSVNETLRRCLGVPPNTPTLMRYALACELPPLSRAVWLTAKELVKQWFLNPALRTQLQDKPAINSSYSRTYEKFKSNL
ncbi:uncharacterized protein LOC118756709 [Rhagoletis pomonella]|uniref:uncharacterized protein LOC118756709 n=1 Tax=Rhagoletis pomonella TaxID=28610 RepID=UPI00177EAB8C|nr:uncharacterized protein LOC118756709 [Rhagoletis pomonella]